MTMISTKRMKKTLSGTTINIYVSTRWCADKNLKIRLKNRKLLQNFLDKNLLAGHSSNGPASESYYSISHSGHLGGFVLADFPVGFDLEPLSRKISVRAALRITNPLERKLKVPSPLHIWVMKEAAWKSLRRINQPTTISRIAITHIRFDKVRRQWRFSFQNQNSKRKINGKGLLWARHKALFAVAHLPVSS